MECKNFQDTFEARKRSFIRAFSMCMTVPLNEVFKYEIQEYLLWNLLFQKSIQAVDTPKKIRFHNDKFESVLELLL